MGSSSSSPGTVTQTNTSTPWSGAVPNLTSVQQQAANLYNSGSGFNPYSGPTYIPPTQQELAGLQGIESAALAGNPLLNPLLSEAAVMIHGGGFATPLLDISQGRTAITETGLGRDNADFQGVVDRAVSDAVDNTSAMFSAGGRYGSTAHQGTVMDTAGDIAGDMYAAQYNIDADRLMQQQAANIANQAGASQSLMSQYNALAGLAPSLNEMRYTDARQLTDVGAALRGETQAQNQSYIDQYNALQQEDWNRLLAYSGIASGAGAVGGTSTTSVPQGSAISGLLGGAATGAALGGSMNSSGSTTALLSLLGAGLGMFA